ncbi:hypothetical protein [Vibrio penaeicida]|uniref:hypothetical protein n=1 Tax=Vibrio penaeicida TaxID=104609 RepID=UPI000CE9AE14|nr:hypothetical protein [Vibrio penaeicida]
MKKPLRFTTEDILNWSQFTGDFNAIHYQGPSQSKRPVQGMLSFIMMSDDILLTSESGGVQSLAITAVFRHHVYTSLPHELVNNGDSLKLLDDKGTNTVSGQYLLKDTMLEWKNKENTELIPIKYRDVFKKYVDFNNRFPFNLSLLTFFNALVFSSVIKSKSFLNFEPYQFCNLEDYLEHSETLHTGQLVEFNIGSNFDLSKKCDLKIFIQPSITIKNGNDTFVRILNYRCLYGEECLFTARTSLVSNMQPMIE